MEGAAMGIRTRYLPELVRKKLLDMGIDETLADVGAKVVMKLGKKDKGGEQEEAAAGDGNEEEGDEGEDQEEDKPETEAETEEEQKKLKTKQIMFLVDDEVRGIAEVIKAKLDEKGEAFGDIKGNDIKKLQNEIGEHIAVTITPDISLFGRMITSSAFRDIQAAIQVAHAVSTNKLEREFDFFTAVDDLQKSGEEMDAEKGAGMMGDVEFNSACYYKYFSLDCDQFIANIAGDEATPAEKEAAAQLLGKVIRAFLRAAALTSPTGKQNTFAAHQLPDAILVEVRPFKLPISYANAFVDPSRFRENKDLVRDSIEKFVKHVNLLNKKYNLDVSKRFWFTARDDESITSLSIDNAEIAPDFETLVADVVSTVPGGGA
jgi:CRISPR system Cascade subunit CasC